MDNMDIEKGQIWVNEEKPYLSIIITGKGVLFDETDEGMYVTWGVYDEDSWSKYVLKKKFNNVGSLEEHIKAGKNTFPYSFGGECSIKSIKQKIRNNKLKVINIKRDFEIWN